MIPIVVDTNVFVGSMLGKGGAARTVVRNCLIGHYEPLMGSALFCEYEDVLGRDELWSSALTSKRERDAVMDGFLTSCRWVEVFFAWRPNLPDDADNHLIELAVAGSAAAIVTRNIRDLTGGELQFPNFRVVTPVQCLEIFPCLP